MYICKKNITMNNKLLLAILVVSTAFFSCKGEKTTENKEEKKVEQNDSFTVTMNLVVQADDNFQIYYNEDGSDIYTADKFVNVDVKGKPEAQEIVFKLPAEAAPASLRFDLGSNKEQKEVKIVDFKMDYFDKHFVAKDTMFVHYFGNNTQIEYIRDKAIAKPKPIPNETYDPLFTGTEQLKKEIQKLVK